MRSVTTLLAVLFTSLACEPTRAEEPEGSHRVVAIEILIADLVMSDKDAQEVPDEAVVDRIRESEKQGKLSRVTRLRLATLSNQQATAQFGEQAPVATGRVSFAGGRGGPGGFRGGGGGDGPTSYSYHNVGTIAQITPRVDGNKVIMECNVEQSRLVPKKSQPRAADPADEDSAPPAASFQPESIETITARSTVQVKSGETVLLTSRQQQSGDESLRTYILVSATVAGEETKEAALLKVFRLVHAKSADAAKVLSEVNKQVTIAVDERTNSLVMQGKPADLDVCEALLLKLDEKE